MYHLQLKIVTIIFKILRILFKTVTPKGTIRDKTLYKKFQLIKSSETSSNSPKSTCDFSIVSAYFHLVTLCDVFSYVTTIC